MGNTDGGGGLIDVLSAGAAGAVGIDPQAHGVISTSRSSLMSGITSQETKEVCLFPAELNGGGTHQTVDAFFRLEIPVGIFSVDLEGHRLHRRPPHRPDSRCLPE